MKIIFFLLTVIISTCCFVISTDLTEVGASITPDMLKKIIDTCDIAYSFYKGDLINNAKYISQALNIQGLERNWDVVVNSYPYDNAGFSGHSINETWWVTLKQG